MESGFVAEIRSAELEEIRALLRVGEAILELGAGTGEQARTLRALGYDLTAVDLNTSEYAAERVSDVIDYDGKRLPFADASFDVVFSSNVLEHVQDLPGMFGELRRVLRPNGFCVHVMPTHVWRIWQTIMSYPAAVKEGLRLMPQLIPRSIAAAEWRRIFSVLNTLVRRCGRLCLPRRHGERGTTLTETFYFHPSWWRRQFSASGFKVVSEQNLQLFYTGHLVLGPALSLRSRRRVAGFLGCATRMYVVQPVSHG